jgi:hypothetical protein
VSSTRNIAFGKASATVPSISIAPSFFAKLLPLRFSSIAPSFGQRASLSEGVKKGKFVLPPLQKLAYFNPELSQAAPATIGLRQNKRLAIWGDAIGIFKV